MERIIAKKMNNFNALEAAKMDVDEWMNRFYPFVGSLKVVMSIVNNAAIETTRTAIEAVEQTPLYRNQVKRDLKAIGKAYEEHLRTLKFFKYRNFDIFEDCTDPEKDAIVADRERIFDIYLLMGQNDYPSLYRHIMMIELQIMQSMTRRQIPNGLAISKLFTAYTLMKHSKIMFGYLMADCKDFLKADLTPLFQPFLMEHVIFLVDRAAHQCGLSHILDVENPAHNVKDLKLAIKIYENAVFKCIRECKGADMAIEQNKELMTDKAYQDYRKRYDEAASAAEARKHRTYEDIIRERKKL